MKKFFALLLALTMLLALAACGGSDPAPAEEEKSEAAPVEEAAEAPEEEAAEAEAPAEEPAPAEEKSSDRYNINVLGAEHFENEDGTAGLRVTYDFYHNEEGLGFPSSVYVEAYQGDTELDWIVPDDYTESYGLSASSVYPGVTVRCEQNFAYDPAGEMLTIVIRYYDENGETEAMLELDPAALPGFLGEPYVREPITEPVMTRGLPSELELEDGSLVKVLDAELVPGYVEGRQVLRVNFEYTNNGSESATPRDMATFEAYQDGLKSYISSPLHMDDGDPAEKLPGDELYFSGDVAPGETVICSYCYAIYSDSPMEVFAAEVEGDGVLRPIVGACFDLAELGQ